MRVKCKTLLKEVHTNNHNFNIKGFNLKQDKKFTWKLNTEARSRNFFCRWKAVSITYSECVFVFMPWLCSMRCACAVLYCHLWTIRLYHVFPHCLINDSIFGKQVTERKMHILIFSTTFVRNNSYSNKN